MTSPSRSLAESDKAAIRAAFEQLRASFDDYRPRASQNLMVACVARALGTSGGIAVAEGPTGVGKSFAYLLAGVPLALASERPLVIATATVALQEQLVTRDIPAFLAATGLQATVELAKGRGRYVCPKNLVELGAHGGDASERADDLFGDLGPAGWTRPPQADEPGTVASLADALSQQTWNGDLDNPPVPIRDELKPLITTTAGACTGRRCAFYDACPAVRARERVKSAQIIVANHDLLIRSLMQHAQDGDAPNFLVNPAEALIVLDEAHSLAEKSIDASAAHVHLPSALVRLPKMRAMIAAVYRATGETEVSGKTLADVHAWLAELATALEDLRNRISLQWQPAPGDRDPYWRAPHGRLPDDWRELASDAARPALALQLWFEKARAVMRKAEVSDALRDRAMRELGGAAEHVAAYAELCELWSCEDVRGVPPIARWVSLGSDFGPVCHASRVSAAGFLMEHLWMHAESVVLTSATLSAGGDFGPLCEALGIPEHAECVSLPSPFNLPEQAVFAVPAFPVLPNDPQHPQAVADWLQANLDWGVASLVLFSSRRKMEAVAGLLPESYRTLVHVQGECSKQQMLDQHARDIHAGRGSVLFGLTSFGEGLDLRGKLCSHVVIAQVPFAVPTEPVGATRAEWYEVNQRNPFVEIAVPEALRTLTQFCGRLIRSETDTGAITVLDRRLVEKKYGRTILQGLPPFRQNITR